MSTRSDLANAHIQRVGRRITVYRERHGWSQRHLATRLKGWTFQTVAEWERGTRLPRTEAQLALARALGVHPDDLFCFRVRSEVGHPDRADTASASVADQLADFGLPAGRRMKGTP